MVDFVAQHHAVQPATAAVIAANTVTIENGVIVTIGGSTPANVYTNVPNYSGSGGNNRTAASLPARVQLRSL